jgi:hypothetical protein
MKSIVQDVGLLWWDVEGLKVVFRCKVPRMLLRECSALPEMRISLFNVLPCCY